MYVCEKCHDRDVDATDCSYTFKTHLPIDDEEIGECDICGKKKVACIFCDEYQAEVMIRSGAPWEE